MIINSIGRYFVCLVYFRYIVDFFVLLLIVDFFFVIDVVIFSFLFFIGFWLFFVFSYVRFFLDFLILVSDFFLIIILLVISNMWGDFLRKFVWCVIMRCKWDFRKFLMYLLNILLVIGVFMWLRGLFNRMIDVEE